jgi:rod shape determining protein RodA
MSELAERPAWVGLPVSWRREVPLLLPAIGITILGVYLLSGSEPDYLQGLRPWLKQTIWGMLGVGLALAVSRLPLSWMVTAAPGLYLLNLVCIYSLHWIGTERGGAVSWVDFGPIRFQPSETMKIITVLLLAKILCPLKSSPGFRAFLFSTLVAAIPAGLILLQPDLGTALVFPGVLLASLYGSRVPRRYLTLILVPIWAVTALPGEVLTWVIWGSGVALWLLLIAWRGESRTRLVLFFLAHLLTVVLVVEGVKPLWNQVLKPHQRDRLAGFIENKGGDTSDLSPAAYHLRQSLIAISSGGLLGQGLGQGLQSSHGFIPMMRTDFIFAVLAEETGFTGAIILFALMILLFLESIRYAARADTWRESTVVFGIIGLWLTHTCVNLGMTMGLTPITGIPFPFLSYGGSSLLSNFLALGVVMSVSRRCPAPEE